MSAYSPDVDGAASKRLPLPEFIDRLAPLECLFAAFLDADDLPLRFFSADTSCND